MNKNALIIILSVVCMPLFSQTHVDALRYSQHGIGGTARSVAMGGAFGALGGDFSSLSINPAGVAVYRSSEFTFTPEIYLSNTNTRYMGNEEMEESANLNINNIGYVANFSGLSSAVKSVSFGIGFNRFNNYNRSYYIEGVNDYSSYSESFADLGNSGLSGGNYDMYSGYDAFTVGLFKDADVLYLDDLGFYLNNGSEGYIDIDGNFIPTRQKRYVEESGRLSERLMSVGVNIQDILFVGATLGWHKIISETESVWKEEEEPLNPGDPYYEYFDFNENLQVRGDGFAAKFGVIFTPIKEIRIGAAIHSPVYYSITEKYTTSITSRYINWDTYFPLDKDGVELDYFQSKYKLQSPAKFVGSFASVIGGLFIVSADLEYQDFSSMKLKPTIDFNDQNRLIKEIYKEAINVKLGGELKLNHTYVRGGVGFYSSPYASSEENSDAWRISYSLGFGFRLESFFVDFAYNYLNYDLRQIQYVVDNPGVTDMPAANIDNKSHRIMTTIGFRF